MLTQMVEGARFVQGQLGGILEDADGETFDEIEEHATVRFVVERLVRLGLEPGEGTVLRIF